MNTTMPRVKRVAVERPSTLVIDWRGGGQDRVDLAGWIATGGEILAPLADPVEFAKATVADHGTAVAWDDDDLRIDAVHLELLAGEQRPFTSDDAAAWQDAVQLSNREVAALLGIGVSTWNAYKAGGAIPAAVAMICRAARRDPLILQAHLQPRPSAGRPRGS
jgi:hypothetical protein